MTYKTILVHLERAPLGTPRLDLAARLAAVFDAHLVGLHAVHLPAIPPYVAAEMPPDILERRAAAARAAAESLKDAFDDKMRRSAVRGEWRQAHDIPLAAMTLSARHADLAVVGQPRADAEDPATNEIARALPLAAGRPVLVVPHAGRFDRVGECITIAWNGGREAARAVADALPLLARAREVIVLSVNPSDGDRVPGADVATFLARHGVKAEARQTVGSDIDAPDLLLSRLADFGADLLVMGAYGHSRLREVVLGGMSEAILRHMTVPVLLSH